MQLLKNLDNKKILIGVGIAVVIILFAMYVLPLLKKAKDTIAEKDTEKDILNNSEIISGGGTPDSFAPRPHTDKIWNDLQAWYPTPEIYQEINQLNDDNLRSIWQDWNQRYKSQYNNRPLRDAIDAGYWNRTSWTVTWTKGAKLIVDRLKAIGLP